MAKSSTGALTCFVIENPLWGQRLKARIREIQANWFAAELLMPAELVRAEWNRKPSMKHLTALFNVSEEAMGYRIDSLDLWVSTNES